MELGVDLKVEEILAREVTETRPGYLNSRVPTSLIDQLNLMAKYLTGKRRSGGKRGAKKISRGDVVNRALAAALESLWKDAGLPKAEATSSDVDALLRELKSPN